VNETVLFARELILKKSKLTLLGQREAIPMTAFIVTVTILSASALGAMILSTNLGAEVALAVMAII
jgi:hypothetical protein